LLHTRHSLYTTVWGKKSKANRNSRIKRKEEQGCSSECLSEVVTLNEPPVFIGRWAKRTSPAERREAACKQFLILLVQHPFEAAAGSPVEFRCWRCSPPGRGCHSRQELLWMLQAECRRLSLSAVGFVYT
jgi:hypothetical protein